MKNEANERFKINLNQEQLDAERLNELLGISEKYNFSNINNIIDFINYVVYKNEFNCSLELMEKISETLIIKKNHLTYINYMNLGLFLGLFLEKINLLKNTEEEKYIWKYKDFWNKIIYLIDKKVLLKIAKGYFTIPIATDKKDCPKYLKDFYYTNGEKEKSSHYIQGAYLERILGTKARVEGNVKTFNPHYTPYQNPYWQYYFYGETILPDAIENILAKNIETKTNDILDAVETSSLKNYFNKKSVCGLKIDKLFIENNSLFVLNYIRTPTFLNDIYEGYFQYLKSIVGESDISTFIIEESNEQISMVELQTISKTFQLSIIEEFLTIFINKGDISIQSCINTFKNNIKKVIGFNLYIVESILLESYLKLILKKLIEFTGYPWLIDKINIKSKIKYFTENLFILKTKTSENVGIFGDKNPIIFAYYPINKDKICFFNIPSIKNNQVLDKKYLDYLCEKTNWKSIYNDSHIANNYRQKALVLKDKIMLNQKRIPFRVIID